MSANIHDVLLALGLDLKDRGKEWRCRPPYRSSSNDMSLSILKESGNFSDFGIGARGTLKDLIKLILHLETKEDVENYLKNLKYEEDDTPLKKPALKMPNIFSSHELDNLLPHYSFFNKRGISDETLRLFGGGLAGEGQMLRRYVFPIWDEQRKNVLGFAGRDMTGRALAKWKLLGQKRFWTYPLFLNADVIQATRELVIVESIGDMLALYEAGVKQVVVLFGIELPHYWALFNRIVSLNPRVIIIGLNNDVDSAVNNGQRGAIKIQKSLSKVFDPRQIIISPPASNDFGAMSKKENLNWYVESIKKAV